MQGQHTNDYQLINRSKVPKLNFGSTYYRIYKFMAWIHIHIPPKFITASLYTYIFVYNYTYSVFIKHKKYAFSSVNIWHTCVHLFVQGRERTKNQVTKQVNSVKFDYRTMLGTSYL